MHRVAGDRTRALCGALTVAGLCRDLTGLRDQTGGVARYHGGRADGPCVRCRLRVFAHAPCGALARMLASAFAWAVLAVASRQDEVRSLPSVARRLRVDRPAARFAV